MAFSFRQLVSGTSDVLSGNLEGKIAGTAQRKKDEEADAARMTAARLSALREQLLGAQADWYTRRPGSSAKAPGTRTSAQVDTEGHRRVRDANAQMSGTARDLGAVRRQKLPVRPPLAWKPGEPNPTPEDIAANTAFVADSTKKANTVVPKERELVARQDSLRAVTDSLTAAAGGRRIPPKPAGATKTAEEWLSDVLAEHPNWPDAQVKAEARRRRAGGR